MKNPSPSCLISRALSSSRGVAVSLVSDRQDKARRPAFPSALLQREGSPTRHTSAQIEPSCGDYYRSRRSRHWARRSAVTVSVSLRGGTRQDPRGTRSARGVTKAGATGLEPATSAVTGQRSNLLSYAPAMLGSAVGGLPRVIQYAKARPSTPPPAKTGQPASSSTSLARWRSSVPRQCWTRAAVGAPRRPPRRAPATVPFPPGETRLSLARTRRFADEPLSLLLECYERYGPIFTLRLFHGNVVFMLGPGRQPLHDGLARVQLPLARIALPRPDRPDGRRPADDRRRLPPPFAADHAPGLPPRAHRGVGRRGRRGDRRARWISSRPATTIDLYAWTRHLAMRVAMRALFGVDPDGEQARSIDAAGLFEEALSFYSTEYFLRVLRDRRTPWARMQRAARKLDAMIYCGDLPPARDRRARPRHPQPAARRAATRTETRSVDLQIRDEVMTLLFAGHDTTTSTVSFMFYELARQPEILARLLAEQDAGSLAGSRAPRDRSATARLRRAPRARDGARRDAAQVPARVGGTAARGRAVRVRRPHASPPARSSTTARGPPTTSPTCSPSRRSSAPSASPPRPARRCRRAPTSPSAEARARASACASASSRCARSRR